MLIILGLVQLATAGDPMFRNWTFLVAVGLALVHFYCGKFFQLIFIPQNQIVSFASGVSVSYVFIHLLPELEAGQRHLDAIENLTLNILEHHIYLMALFGLMVFYGLEKFATSSRQRNKQRGGDKTDSMTFWIHTISFGAYNTLIGYLLVQQEEFGVWRLLVFAIAIAFHFVANDQSLWEHHKYQYDHTGRWFLAGVVIFGWSLGQVIKVSDVVIASLFAFLAGGIILNVIKDELPPESNSSFRFFCLGSILYTIILLILEAI